MNGSSMRSRKKSKSFWKQMKMNSQQSKIYGTQQRQSCIVLLRTSFAVLHRFWVVVCSFSFVPRYFLISSLISFLTHSLFNTILFNHHEFECFWVFSLRLVSSFKPLCSKKMLDIVSVFLNLLRLVLCPIIWKHSTCIWKEYVFWFFGMKVSIYIS